MEIAERFGEPYEQYLSSKFTLILNQSVLLMTLLK